MFYLVSIFSYFTYGSRFLLLLLLPSPAPSSPFLLLFSLTLSYITGTKKGDVHVLVLKYYSIFRFSHQVNFFFVLLRGDGGHMVRGKLELMQRCLWILGDWRHNVMIQGTPSALILLSRLNGQQWVILPWILVSFLGWELKNTFIPTPDSNWNGRE